MKNGEPIFHFSLEATTVLAINHNIGEQIVIMTSTTTARLIHHTTWKCVRTEIRRPKSVSSMALVSL